MKKAIVQEPNVQLFKEWVFYDGQCSVCIEGVHKFLNTLNKRGVGVTPLQTDWVKSKIFHLDDPLKEMLLLTEKESLLGGADALIYLSRKIWWAYGLFLLAQIPGMKMILRRLYRLIAKNRYCLSGQCSIH